MAGSRPTLTFFRWSELIFEVCEGSLHTVGEKEIIFHRWDYTSDSVLRVVSRVSPWRPHGLQHATIPHYA